MNEKKLNSFLVVRCLYKGSIKIKKAKIYNEVEIGSYHRLLSNEKNILEASLKSFNEINSFLDNFQNEQILSSIEIANDIIEADRKAEIKMLEMLDIFDICSKNMEISNLLNGGYIKNLEENDIYIREKKYEKNYYFEINNNKSKVWNIDEIHDIMLRISKKNEFNEAIIKWYHWRRIIKLENNLHIKLNMYWFALEGIIKMNNDDQIIHKLMAIIGFVEGFVGKDIYNEKLKERIIKSKDYKKNKKKVNNMLEKIRIKRNNTVHQSIKTTIENYTEICEELSLLEYINESLEKFIIECINIEITTKKEFWEKFSIIFSKIYQNSEGIQLESIINEYYDFREIKYSLVEKETL